VNCSTSVPLLTVLPDELIQDVGVTGLGKQEEHANRERKFSSNGGDVRNFYNPRTEHGHKDPFYQRKPVPDALVQGVGETGLTPEEEYLGRERKYSVNGSDVRRFSSGPKGLEPASDPYYSRKPVASEYTDPSPS